MAFTTYGPSTYHAAFRVYAVHQSERRTAQEMGLSRQLVHRWATEGFEQPDGKRLPSWHSLITVRQFSAVRKALELDEGAIAAATNDGLEAMRRLFALYVKRLKQLDGDPALADDKILRAVRVGDIATGLSQLFPAYLYLTDDEGRDAAVMDPRAMVEKVFSGFLTGFQGLAEGLNFEDLPDMLPKYPREGEKGKPPKKS